MAGDEQRDTTRGQQQEDPERFNKITRTAREQQSPRTGEEGTEEDRGQWEKTRDIRKEAEESPEPPERPQQEQKGRERLRRGSERDDQLEAPPGD